VTITIPSLVVVIWGNKKREESHLEHEEGVKAAQNERAILAVKVEEVAENVAKKLGDTTASTMAAIKQVHEEVKTANALKLGELADATETRRVQNIPHEDRTQAEQEHIDAVPPKP
jgi:hypothetical protein